MSIGDMRCERKPARSTDPHALHAVENTIDEAAPVKQDLGKQRLNVSLKSRGTDRTPCSLPANRLPVRQPKVKANSVTLPAAHQFATAGHFTKQRQTGSQAAANRLLVPRQQSCNVGQSRRAR